MKYTLTPEEVAAVKLKPDDAKLAQWVVDMRVLKAATERAEELLHARLDESGTVVAKDGTQITRKISGGSYTVNDPLEFFGAVRELLPSDSQIAACFKPSMDRLKDEIAVGHGVAKGGKGAVTAATIFESKLRPLVTQGVKRTLQFL